MTILFKVYLSLVILLDLRIIIKYQKGYSCENEFFLASKMLMRCFWIVLVNI